MSQCELDQGNIINFTDEEVSPEYCQAMEDFMKQNAEHDCQEVENLVKKKLNRIDFTTCCISRRLAKAR
jgi:hypothetical protein